MSSPGQAGYIWDNWRDKDADTARTTNRLIFNGAAARSGAIDRRERSRASSTAFHHRLLYLCVPPGSAQPVKRNWASRDRSLSANGWPPHSSAPRTCDLRQSGRMVANAGRLTNHTKPTPHSPTAHADGQTEDGAESNTGPSPYRPCPNSAPPESIRRTDTTASIPTGLMRSVAEIQSGNGCKSGARSTMSPGPRDRRNGMGE